MPAWGVCQNQGGEGRDDVPDYALVLGNPARQTGWMSRAGYRLEFSQDGMAVCPGTGEKYFLKDGKVTLIEHNN